VLLQMVLRHFVRHIFNSEFPRISCKLRSEDTDRNRCHPRDKGTL
jgi:hypothetical protein